MATEGCRVRRRAWTPLCIVWVTARPLTIPYDIVRRAGKPSRKMARAHHPGAPSAAAPAGEQLTDNNMHGELRTAGMSAGHNESIRREREEAAMLSPKTHDAASTANSSPTVRLPSAPPAVAPVPASSSHGSARHQPQPMWPRTLPPPQRTIIWCNAIMPSMRPSALTTLHNSCRRTRTLSLQRPRRRASSPS